jgi:hypothetical protein
VDEQKVVMDVSKPLDESEVAFTPQGSRGTGQRFLPPLVAVAVGVRLEELNANTMAASSFNASASGLLTATLLRS